MLSIAVSIHRSDPPELDVTSLSFVAVERSREPYPSTFMQEVSLGEVEGDIHLPVSLLRGPTTNTKSSRRGKEETKPRIVGSGTMEYARKSDLSAEENPCNWTGEAP